jgi:hypothetical protein
MPACSTIAAGPSVLLLACAVSCGGEGVDFHVHGAGVVVRTEAPFARRADLPARMEAALSAALEYWGGGWAHLAGTRIALLDGPYVPCGASAGAIGCYDGDFRISASDPGAGTFSCLEQTALVHEVGHAVIGDALHQDPRWMDFAPVRDALAGAVKYGAGGEVECEIAVSVWRHPPDAR